MFVFKEAQELFYKHCPAHCDSIMRSLSPPLPNSEYCSPNNCTTGKYGGRQNSSGTGTAKIDGAAALMAVQWSAISGAVTAKAVPPGKVVPPL